MMGNSLVTNSNAVKQIINVSPQETAVASKLSIKENLEVIARIYGDNAREAAKKRMQCLRLFA